MNAINQILSAILVRLVSYLDLLGSGWKLILGLALSGTSLAAQNCLHLFGVGEPLHSWADYALVRLLWLGLSFIGVGTLHKLLLATPPAEKTK